MFYVTREEYFCSVSIIAHRLRQWSSVDIVILMVDSYRYSQSTLAHVKSLPNVYIKNIENLEAPNAEIHWKQSWNKFYVFDQTEYDRVVYIDADTYILKNMDHLFMLPSVALAAPRAYWLEDKNQLTSMLLVIEPNHQTFLSLVQDAKDNGGFDMDVINRLYINSNDFLMLPSIYGLLNSEYHVDEPHHFGSDLQATWDRSVLFHWSSWKPWNLFLEDPKAVGHGDQFYQTWRLYRTGYEQYCL
eukprot:gene7582-8873_t